MPFPRALFLVPLLLAATACPAMNGGVSLNHTRVIFAAGDKAQTVMVKNTGQQNYLIQSRMQNQPDNPVAGSFIATPPLFPLAAQSSQMLRILKQDDTLPADRESLSYLTVLAIPAQTEPSADDARLSMGFQFMIKLFYRPQGLKITPEQASCQLTFSRTAQGIRAENPTPYFLTFGSLNFGKQRVDLDNQPSMIAPMSSATYRVAGPVAQVRWQTLTDVGGLSSTCLQPLLSPQETL
ncbi:Chaperone protein fimC precursor [Serratia fonticola]|uniref:fimbrial biogenesis chaperone n=1 Tax=Serratia fonticola TaxID=47917 RepID=UPI00217703ED|nr:molecular chaperone [Serratia fonticola]CAI1949631.1 Chaperone protein fimC precursor [Serratia fonticola]